MARKRDASRNRSSKHSSRTVYRDSKTGRFVKKSSWERSKSDRFNRQRIILEPKRKPKPPEEIAWLISSSYKPKERGDPRISVDFIARGEASLPPGKDTAIDLLNRWYSYIPEGFRWYADLIISEAVQAEATPAPGETVPTSIWVRSFVRGKQTEEFASEADFESEDE